MTRKWILAALVPAVFAVSASASELTRKFDQTASAFVQAGKARNLEGAALAVFPFQADEKLSKKRVDFAVGELLASQLLAKGYYKLTERAQLEEVLREQKLGMSGAVDSATAASVGKLLGARLMVLGNVIRLGKSYQITAKLVESETSEMIASQITEVPVETFDQEAGRFLVLVPEHQAIGIFVGLGYGFLSTDKTAVQNYDGTFSLTPTNADLPEGAGTFGVRYWAKPRWMVQVDFSSLFSNTGGTTENLYTANLPPSIAGKIRTGYTGFRLRAGLDRTTKISPPLTWHYGGGLSFTNLDNIDMDKSDVSATYPGGYTVMPDTNNTTNFFTPFVRTGVEWRPQARFGWSLFANLNLLSKDYEQGVTVSGPSGSRDITLWKVSLPRFYLDSTIALYF